MAAVQFSDFISICRNGVEYKAFVGDLPFDGGGNNDVENFVEKRGDTMTGPLLLYAETPTNDLEAASKAYVDLVVAANVIPSDQIIPEAPADGHIYVRNGQTKSWVRGLPYDVRTLPELS